MARRRRLIPAQPGYVAPPAPDADPAPSATRAPLAPIAQVSGQSAEAAALRELTQGVQQAREEGRMVVDVPLSDVSPGHFLRDRLDLDQEALGELISSIRASGQRSPAEITPITEPGASHQFALVSGWRRLSALNALYKETNDPRFSTLRALIRPREEVASSYLAMVEENEIRRGLSYYERARIVAETTARGIYPDQSAALRHLFANASRAKRSKIASFIDIHDQLGDLLLFPAHIPERLGLSLVSSLRLNGAAKLRKALMECPRENAAAELAVLEKYIRQAARAPVSRAKHLGEMIAPGVALHAEQSGQKIKLTLSGAGVDAALFAQVQQLLRGVKTGG